nr:MYB-1 [Neurospora crassa]
MSNMPDQRRGPWSAGEDQRLIKLVKDLGPGNWVNVARILGTRTPKQCRERWHQNLKPGLNHGPMTQEEAAIIVREVDLKGPRWADIARKLQGRSDNAVKNYWNGLNNRKKNQLRRQSAPRRVSASDVLRSSPGQLPRAHMQRPSDILRTSTRDLGGHPVPVASTTAFITASMSPSSGSLLGHSSSSNSNSNRLDALHPSHRFTLHHMPSPLPMDIKMEAMAQLEALCGS